MQKPGEILEQIQRIASDMQNKVGEAIRNSPAQEIEKNVRAMMNQGFQKMDLVTREEFDLQSKVLAKTREKLEALEAKVAALEKAWYDSEFCLEIILDGTRQRSWSRPLQKKTVLRLPALGLYAKRKSDKSKLYHQMSAW